MRPSTARAALLYGLIVGATLLVRVDDLEASEAKIRSLMNSPMVEDVGDIIDFPGTAAAWNNTIFVNLGRQGSLLSGGASDDLLDNFNGSNGGGIVGDKVVFGAWLHRWWLWQDLDEIEELFELEQPLPKVHNIADLVLGTRKGFGLRLSFAAGLDSEETYDPGKDKMVSTGGSAFGGELQVGYSFDARRYHGDFGAGITFSTFTLLQDGRTAAEGGLVPSFSFRHRSRIGKGGGGVSGVIDLSIVRRAYTIVTNNPDGGADTEGEYGRWHAYLVAGPRLDIPGLLTLTLGVRLSLEDLEGEVAKQEQPQLIAFEIPGAVATCEVYLADILYLRGGITYKLYLTRVKAPDDPNTEDDDRYGSRTLGQGFYWAFGIGVAPGDFEIDATVSEQLLFDGPDFIGGEDPGLFGMLSASYTW